MNCEINQKLVGCRVVIETNTGMIEGDVRNVDPSCAKMSLVNGVVLATGVQLPSLYRLFMKDILSIRKVGENIVADATPVASPIYRSSLPIVPAKSPSHQTGSDQKGDRKFQPLVVQKKPPSHIKTLNNNIDTDILTNKVPFMKDGKNLLSSSLINHTVIDEIDDLYLSAIDRIKRESVIGLSMEGVRIGRFGTVCWIGVAVSDHAFLFDMCCLGPSGVQQGLANILVNGRIVKVTHDCRYMSDAFLHQYGVKLENVFDTQVGASVVDLKKHGFFNRNVYALTRCLNDFLDIPPERMFHRRVREGYEKEDDAIWKHRPLPQHLVEGAVFNVCHLKRLRLAIMETLMSEVTLGTNLYLKEVSELPDDCVTEKGVTAHVIPMSFKDLVKNRKFSNSEEFQIQPISLKDGCDPYVSFTRHIPHVRKS